jgi:hypothetical protein
MSRALLFLAALASICSVRAQQPPLSGPVEGFVYDAPTGSIRGVIGSLGSASLGPAIVPLLDFASVAPRQSYALAVQRGQTLLISGLTPADRLASANPSVTALAGSFSVPDGVAWSGDGSVAVLYSRIGNWIQAITGLPGSAVAGPLLSLVPLGGSLSAIATDLHGARIAIGMTGGHAGVYGLVGGQSWVPTLDASNPVALAFSDSGALYALDAATRQLFEVGVSETGSVDSAAQTWPVALNDGIAVQSSLDASNRQILYIAGRSDRLLLTYDVASHQRIASVPLPFEPTTINPLGNVSFLMRSRSASTDPLWSFTNSPQFAVYFVPATPLSNLLEPHGLEPGGMEPRGRTRAK